MKKYNVLGVEPLLLSQVYKACNRLRMKLDDVDGTKINFIKGDSASLEIKSDEINIVFSKKYELFYALKLIMENERKKSFKCNIDCKFEHLGVMMDCSRNAVPNVEFLKDYILNLALMGYNELQLYTEDTYEIEGEPMFGYLRGRFTALELREVIEFAAQFDIEVVPCIQTLAHLNQIFRWSCYDKVRDIDDILLVGQPETYELIDKMFASLSKVFTCRRIHIGMDEAHHLGRGKYTDMNGSVNKNKIMLDHLTKVVEIARKYGFEPMMWSDMFFRINYGGYGVDENSPRISEDVINLVPEGLKLVYWDYYSDDKSRYDIMFDRHADFVNNETCFAGGAWRWRGWTPKNKISCRRTKLAFQSAVEHNVKSFLLTEWGDNGAECSWNAILPAMNYTADLAYGDEAHDESFFALTGMDFNGFSQLDLPDEVRGSNAGTFSKDCLFNDYFLGVLDPLIVYGEQNKYKEYASKLHKLAKAPSNYSYVFETEACLCDVLALKLVLGKQTRDVYRKIKLSDNEQGNSVARNELKKLIKTAYVPLLKLLDKFYDAFRIQWYKENKPFGFEIQDARLGGLIKRTEHCMKVLKEFAKGNISTIPELDEQLVKPEYGSRATETYFDINCYTRSISTGNM